MFAMISSTWDSASEETSVKGHECGVEGVVGGGGGWGGGKCIRGVLV